MNLGARKAYLQHWLGAKRYSNPSSKTATCSATVGLLNVGPGGYADYAGKNVAIACVMMNWGDPDSTLLPYGSVKPAWGMPEALLASVC